MSKLQSKRPYHHGNLSTELVEQGIKLLEEEGLEALTLRRVAKEAGVSPAAPYSHFKGKKALMTAVAKEGYLRFERKLQQGAENDEDYVVGLGLGYVQFALENPALFEIMFSRELVEMIEFDASGKSFGSSYQLLVRTMQRNPLEQFGSEYQILDTVFVWSLVHGVAKLLLADRLTPTNYACEDADGLVRKMLVKYLTPFKRGDEL